MELAVIADMTGTASARPRPDPAFAPPAQWRWATSTRGAERGCWSSRTGYCPGMDGIDDGFVRVRGASEHNLKDVDVDVPRGALVAFTGISGSGKSSLAFGTLYAEAQRRYFESVAPYARRLLQQVAAPHVRDITGLPPAVALQQRRSAPSSRSTVGTLTTLSNLLRMLYSRAGSYPPGAAHLPAEAFSPNTAAGACPTCHGLGEAHDVTEQLMVPDPSLSIRQGAIAAWPGAWQGANLRSVVTGLGIDVDVPFRKLKKKDRDFLLWSEEQPSVLIEPEPERVDYGYYGKFWSARKHVMHTLTTSKSQRSRDRALRFVQAMPCPACEGSGLQPQARAVRYAGLTLPAGERAAARRRAVLGCRPSTGDDATLEAARLLTADLAARIGVLRELGLGYLSLGRHTTTLSPGETQRLRIATQLRSGLFGVVYVLDEPSAGLHPADAEPLLAVLERLKAAGNSLFVVEHDLDVVRRADWVVDLGPGAGEGGGEVLHSGPVADLETGEGVRDQRAPIRACRGGGLARTAAARMDRAAVPAPAQPGGPRRRRADLRADRDHRSQRFGQVQPSGRARSIQRRPFRPGGAGRPATDRPHPAQQPRDVHGPVRRGTQAVCADRRCPGTRVRSRALFLQRRGGTLRDLRGRRVRVRRAAVPARHVRPLPHLPRRALQRGHPFRSDTTGGPSRTCSP